ncbi:MAG: hypothetical protein QOF01_379 [Thermomicrobiales bacterium]|nr:hypothetical protein [Thermomicrobiales bacterium]
MVILSVSEGPLLVLSHRRDITLVHPGAVRRRVAVISVEGASGTPCQVDVVGAASGHLHQPQRRPQRMLHPVSLSHQLRSQKEKIVARPVE